MKITLHCVCCGEPFVRVKNQKICGKRECFIERRRGYDCKHHRKERGQPPLKPVPVVLMYW